jgi:hypothetical protein
MMKSRCDFRKGTVIMWNTLLWLYITNATLLITHEIDSAFWKEWELFRLPGGISGFLLLHLPMIFFILLGLVWVLRQSTAGLIMSLVLAVGGLFAFCIHTYFLRRGRPEFRTTVSVAILIGTLITSLAQGGVTLWFLLV